MPLYEIVEATVDFEKLSSDVELQEMLHGLKKTDLTRLCRRYRLKSNSNKPERIGEQLEKWKRGRGIDGCRNFTREDTSHV